MKDTAAAVEAAGPVDTAIAAQPQTRSRFAKRVMHSFAWESGAQLAGQLISWAVTLMVIRMLSPTDYGLMAMTMLLINFFFMVADFGVGAAAVQAEQVDLRGFRSVLGLILITTISLAVITFVTAPLVATFFDEPRITPLARTLSVSFVLFAFAALPRAQLIRNMDFRTKGKVEVQATAVGALISLVMATAGFGVWALVGGVLGQRLASAIGYQLAAPALIMPNFSLTALSPMLRFGALLSADRVVFFFYGSIDSVIVGKMLGEEALGLYAAALAFSAAPIQKVIPAITQVSFAAFARIQSDMERVRRNLLLAIRLASAFIFPALLGMAAVAPTLLTLVLGEQWDGALVPFQILCLVLPLRSIAAIQSSALLGTGRAGLNLTNMLISFALMTVAFLVGVRWGLLGVSLGWAIMLPVVFLVTSARTSRSLGVPMHQWLTAPGLVPLFAVVMYGAVVLISYILPDSLSAVSRLIVMVLSGVLVYGSLVFAADRKLVQELRATLAR